MKYCRPKKATEILKLHVEHKILRNEFKMNTKQAKKTPGFTQKRKSKKQFKKIHQPGKLFALQTMQEEKSDLLKT